MEYSRLNLLLWCVRAHTFDATLLDLRRVEVTAYIFRDNGKSYIGSAFPGEA